MAHAAFTNGGLRHAKYGVPLSMPPLRGTSAQGQALKVVVLSLEGAGEFPERRTAKKERRERPRGRKDRRRQKGWRMGRES